MAPIWTTFFAARNTANSSDSTLLENRTCKPKIGFLAIFTTLVHSIILIMHVVIATSVVSLLVMVFLPVKII